MSTQALVDHFATHDHHAGLDVGFAGDPRLGILLDDGVEHGIGDLVGNLVRMTFGYGLGGKQVTVCHLCFGS
jgi:hypothetical protein